MPPVSEAQRRAMFAAAKGQGTLGIPREVGKEFVQAKDGNGHAAGILFVAPDGDILLLRRSSTEKNFGGHWALPGGKGEEGETPQDTARRETGEEIGDVAGAGGLLLFDSTPTPTGMAFHTFVQPAKDKFVPKLNEEHSGYAWAPLNQLPGPMHPAVMNSLVEQLGIQDVDAADMKAVCDGFAAWARAMPLHAADAMAFDKDTVRSVDADGRLHVELTNISKANVCPYMGREIPDWQALGLNPDKVYQLYRDPAELEKAAPTFNNIPLLSQHVPVSADDHQPGLVVGSTGTDAAFDAPYLRNSMVIWVKGSIASIESGDQKELSSAYRYRADMAPGTAPDGTPYDGVMRDIIGNHVALVKEGRAGADVVVGDSREGMSIDLSTLCLAADEVKHDPSNGQFAAGGGGGSAAGEKTKTSVAALKTKLEGMSQAKLTAALSNKDVDPAIKKHIEKELDSRADRGTQKGHGEAHDSNQEISMHTKLLTRKAAMASGAIAIFLKPRLAQDTKLDLSEILADVTAKNFKDKKAGIVTKIKAASAGKLAQDASVDDIVKLVDALEDVQVQEGADIDPSSGLPMAGATMDAGTGAEALRAFLTGKMSEEDVAKACAMIASGAADADPADKDKDKDKEKDADKVDKKAMDAAIEAASKKATTDATAAASKNFAAVRDAEKAVRPYVGELAIAHDSAESVYRTALTTLGVKVDGIHASAFPALLAAQPLPNARKATTPTLGQDAAGAKSFAERFPGTAHIGSA